MQDRCHFLCEDIASICPFCPKKMCETGSRRVNNMHSRKTYLYSDSPNDRVVYDMIAR